MAKSKNPSKKKLRTYIIIIGVVIVLAIGIGLYFFFKKNGNGVYVGCPRDCSGHGVCQKDLTCTCDDDWYGIDCSTQSEIADHCDDSTCNAAGYLCDYVNDMCPTSCSDNSVCYDYNICIDNNCSCNKCVQCDLSQFEGEWELYLYDLKKGDDYSYAHTIYNVTLDPDFSVLIFEETTGGSYYKKGKQITNSPSNLKSYIEINNITSSGTKISINSTKFYYTLDKSYYIVLDSGDIKLASEYAIDCSGNDQTSFKSFTILGESNGNFSEGDSRVGLIFSRPP